VKTFNDATQVRTDGDPESDSTWAEWKAANGEAFGDDAETREGWFYEIARALAGSGEWIKSGAVAGFEIAVVGHRPAKD